MSEDDFLMLYQMFRPLENVNQDVAIEIITKMMTEISGKEPEVYNEDGVFCIGNVNEGMFILSDGVLDAVIKKNGVLMAVKSNEPLN